VTVLRHAWGSTLAQARVDGLTVLRHCLVVWPLDQAMFGTRDRSRSRSKLGLGSCSPEDRRQPVVVRSPEDRRRDLENKYCWHHRKSFDHDIGLHLEDSNIRPVSASDWSAFNVHDCFGDVWEMVVSPFLRSGWTKRGVLCVTDTPNDVPRASLSQVWGSQRNTVLAVGDCDAMRFCADAAARRAINDLDMNITVLEDLDSSLSQYTHFLVFLQDTRLIIEWDPTDCG